jgi:Na+-transporting methylmalonyl-CoA/oxaloacetate decarboxylase gamma subunit
MAVLFLLLAVLVGVVLGDAVLENSTAGTVTLFDRSFDQLNDGEFMLVFAGLGFLLALFLFLAFGARKARRTRRRELRSARRDAESRVDELEHENARLHDELARAGRVGRLGHDERPVPTAPPVGERPAGPPQPTSRHTERIDDRTVSPSPRPTEREAQRR